MARRAKAKKGTKGKSKAAEPKQPPAIEKTPEERLLTGIDEGELLDPRLTKAMAHEMRINIMAVISWRVIAPSEYARETGQPLGKVSYHFRKLRDYEIIELAKTEQVRGSTKHYYQGTRRAIFGGAAWADLPKSVQDGVAGAALKDFINVAVSSIEGGAFSARDESFFMWEPLTYDELAFKAAEKILLSTRERLRALQDESLPRLAKTGNEGILAAVTLSCFEMAT